MFSSTMRTLQVIFLCQIITILADEFENNNSFSSNILRNIRRYQQIAIENFKHIDDVFNFTQDTPREYDLRLPWGVYSTPKEQKFVPTPLKFPRFELYSTIMQTYFGSGASSIFYRLSKKLNKLQEKIPESVPFPCKIEGTRSKIRPTSAHKLRPGDIDVVISIGDSISIGMGVAATSALDFYVDSNGLSAFGGGQGTWRQFLTLPNILKVFNPNLYGYATGDTFVLEVSRRAVARKAYNWGSQAVFTDDMPMLFRTSIAKLKRDPKVDFQNDWKMFTIFLGGIDLCQDICYWKRPHEAINHMKYTVDRAMTFLMENSPRTLVNFIPMINTFRYADEMVGVSPACKFARAGMCTCSQALSFRNVSKILERWTHKFIREQISVLENPKFQQKEDFAIVIQPIITNLTIPRIKTTKGITTDFKLLAADCFHVSQRGHAFLSSMLWNSFMSPSAEKRIFYEEGNLLKGFVCPTKKRPYIPTFRN